MIIAILKYLWFNSFLISGFALMSVLNQLGEIKANNSFNKKYLELEEYKRLKDRRNLLFILFPFCFIGVPFLIAMIEIITGITDLAKDTLEIPSYLKYAFIGLYIALIALVWILFRRKRKQLQQMSESDELEIKRLNKKISMLGLLRVYMFFTFFLSYEYFQIITVNIFAGNF